MGTPFDCCSYQCYVELGNGNKKVVPCFQNTHILWNSKGKETEETGMLIVEGMNVFYVKMGKLKAI